MISLIPILAETSPSLAKLFSFLWISSTHSHLFALCLWNSPEPSIWPWDWNYPLDSGGFIHGYTVEDNDYPSRRISVLNSSSVEFYDPLLEVWLTAEMPSVLQVQQSLRLVLIIAWACCLSPSLLVLTFFLWLLLQCSLSLGEKIVYKQLV